MYQNFKLNSINASLFLNGEVQALKYLGSEEEERQMLGYYVHGNLKKYFESLTMAEMILAIGVWCFLNPDPDFDQFESKNEKIIDQFKVTWYDPDLPGELDINKFLTFSDEDWEDEDGDQLKYNDLHNSGTIIFEEPDNLGYYAIFIKPAYYDQLLKDLTEIHQLM